MSAGPYQRTRQRISGSHCGPTSSPLRLLGTALLLRRYSSFNRIATNVRKISSAATAVSLLCGIVIRLIGMWGFQRYCLAFSRHSSCENASNSLISWTRTNSVLYLNCWTFTQLREHGFLTWSNTGVRCGDRGGSLKWICTLAKLQVWVADVSQAGPCFLGRNRPHPWHLRFSYEFARW